MSWSVWGASTEDEIKRELRDTQDELDALRADVRRQVEEDAARRAQERVEAEERYEWDIRQASDWPECLHKQSALLSAEAALSDDDDCFAFEYQATERALELWSAAWTEIEPEVTALQQRIDTLRDGIRLKVADTLEAEGLSKELVGALRQYTDADCSQWLWW